MKTRLLGSIKLPGFIQIVYSPEGAAGGGTEPAGGGSASGSGATPTTPASAPSTPSPAAPSSPSGDASATPATPASPQPLPEDPFSGFGAEESDDDESPTAAAAPEEPAAEATPPQPSAAPAPAQPQAPQAPQQAQPGPQEAGATPPQPQLPTPAEPARMATSILENLDAMAEHLAQTPEFKLSEADIEAINNDVTVAIPKLMARTFLRAQAGALSQMERVVPALVERFMTVSKARDAAKSKFYDRWKDTGIDRTKHDEIVDRLAKTYRKENPQATLEQVVEDLGPLVMMVAKIVPPAPGAAPRQNGQAGTPMVAGRRPPSPPFQPAVGGPASPPSAQAPDPWSGYGAESTDE